MIIRKTNKLGDLIYYINGGAWPATAYAEDGKGIPVVRVTDIQNFTINLSACKYLKHEFRKKYVKHQLESGDLIVCTVGSHPTQQSSVVGKSAVVTEKTAGAYLNQNAVILRAKEEYLDKSWLSFFARTTGFKEHVESNARGSANQVRLAISSLIALDIELPTLQAQRRTAEILSALDDKIELNRRMNQTLEQMAQTLFRQYFVDGIDADNLLDGWRYGRLEEICENFDSKRIPLSSRQRQERKGKYPYYGAASLMDSVDDFIFDGTYILLGEDGTVIDSKGYPILQYVWGKFWVNNHAHVLKGKSYFSTNFLYMVLKNSQVAHLVTGAVQPKINQGNLNRLEILIPEETICKKFSEEIDPLFEKIKNNLNQTETLTILRDTLLPKLMSGEIDVMQTKTAGQYEEVLS